MPWITFRDSSFVSAAPASSGLSRKRSGWTFFRSARIASLSGGAFAFRPRFFLPLDFPALDASPRVVGGSRRSAAGWAATHPRAHDAIPPRRRRTTTDDSSGCPNDGRPPPAAPRTARAAAAAARTRCAMRASMAEDVAGVRLGAAPRPAACYGGRRVNVIRVTTRQLADPARPRSSTSV
eukprot:29991-Pelagococcus_subviridis.AAC.5